MTNQTLSLLCLALTLLFYYLSKWLYGRKRILPLMPLLLAPALLIALVLSCHIPYETYMADSHWLLWLLGPATIAFAIPVYENKALMRKHWLSLSIGVLASVVMAVGSSVLLARWLGLSDLLQRSLAMRSITTPFAVEASKSVGGQSDLTALFVVLTGVIGMAVGMGCCAVSPSAASSARGGLWRIGPRGRHRQGLSAGQRGGVVASMVMMIAGMVTVLLAPLLGQLLW